MRGLLRVARGFGPGGLLVLATGSAGDTANSSGVERSRGPACEGSGLGAKLCGIVDDAF